MSRVVLARERIRGLAPRHNMRIKVGQSTTISEYCDRIAKARSAEQSVIIYHSN